MAGIQSPLHTTNPLHWCLKKIDLDQVWKEQALFPVTWNERTEIKALERMWEQPEFNGMIISKHWHDQQELQVISKDCDTKKKDEVQLKLDESAFVDLLKALAYWSG